MRIILFILLFFSLQSQAQIIRANPLYRPFLVASGGCPNNANATAWIAASGITDSTGIHCFFNGLVDSSLYSYMSSGAAWFLFGGSDAACKLNIFNPVNSDGAYRLSFSGTWSFSSTGADPNGTNAYANTHIVPSSFLVADSFHLSYYSRQSVTGVQELMSAYNAAGQNIQLIINNSYTGSFTLDAYNSPASRLEADATNTTGFLAASRTDYGTAAIYKNGISLGASTTSATGTIPNINMYLAAANVGGTPVLFASPELSFASWGHGLSPQKIRALNNLVEQLMDARGIGVQ